MSQPWPVQLESTSESDQASLSPRTALLSPPPFEDVDEPRRIPRGPGLRFRHERERAHSTASQRDLLNMLVSEEYESKQTRKVLYTAFDRLELETKRADAAEARINDMVRQVRNFNEARVAAQQQAVRAQEELKLYKMQLDNAQKEILRAQDILKAIETQRDEAEAAAVSARSKARRLNEERLIELAREEGRRLGFDEGVRRGRKIAYRDAYGSGIEDRRDEVRDVATVVVDRLLEARDGPEQIEVLEEPTPVPPPSISRAAPEVHRLGTSVHSSLENQRHGSRSRHDSDNASRSTLRRAPEPVIPSPTAMEPRVIHPGIPTIPISVSQASRPQSVSQPWTGPPTDPPFSRPTSVQNSPPGVRHSEIHVPPDGYIPTADANHRISLPPPHELHRTIPSPTPSQQTLGPASERGRSRDYMYDNFVPPRRGSPDDSLASGKQSAASTISQLDIVGLPTGARHRHQGLSVIHEDASMRSDRMSDYSQTMASTHHAGQAPFPEMRSSETLRQDRKAKQRFADELRYSDPSAAEQWRRQSESSRTPHDGPPRHLPPHVTVPTPLSPPRVLQQSDSRQRRSASERQGRSEARSENRDQRRPVSSDSSVPEINVEPPSGPPSDAPSRGRGTVPVSGFLSPDHANLPLPVPAPPPGTGGRSSPVIPNVQNHSVVPPANSAAQIYAVTPDGQIPLGFIPSPTVNGSSQSPVIPQSTGGGAPSQHHAPPYRPPSERETGRSRTPISFYAASPVPAGVTYPAPPISRSATYHGNSYPQSAGSNPSNTSEGRRRRDSVSATAGIPYSQSAGSNPSVTSEGRRRRDSLNATAGTMPASRQRPVQSTGSVDGGGRDPRDSRRHSNASLASQQSRPYSRYNPSMYNDPAYLSSNESLVNSVTGANTTANGGRPVRPGRLNGSPAYMYTTLGTND